MADLQALLDALARAEAVQDVDAMREARSQIVGVSPNSAQAAEALYKLALDKLFVGRNLPESIALLEQAVKGNHPFWVSSARTSLALCYLQQKRSQKALFELRRVAYGRVPSAHSVTALMFMETIFAQEHKADDADKARSERQQQLQQLLEGRGEAPLGAVDRGHYLHQLALTHAAASERSKAQAALAEALALGQEALGQELYQTVRQAAQSLG